MLRPGVTARRPRTNGAVTMALDAVLLEKWSHVLRVAGDAVGSRDLSERRAAAARGALRLFGG